MNAAGQRARVWHALVAVLVLAGLVLQLRIAWLVPAHPSGHAVGALRGTGTAGRLVRVLSFFTIQSNLLCAFTSWQLARDPNRDGMLWRVVRLDALFGITVTGIVYGTVLARVHEPHGWLEVTSNALFHYVVPIATVLGWLLFGPRPRINGRVVGWGLAWPLAWLGYTLVRGAMWGWYPYPFLDVTTHGYGRVLLNALVVTAVFAAVAVLFGWGERRLPAAPARPRST